MSEQMKQEQAAAVFATLCQTLDKHEWRYKKDEKNLTIECGAQGDDLPMELVVKVDVERMLVMLFSHLPMVIQDDKRLDIAIAISAINNKLVDGSFDYDIKSGHIFFRMTNCYFESRLSEELFTYMLFCSAQTIDAYNDQLLMLAKGMLSIQQFLSAQSN